MQNSQTLMISLSWKKAPKRYSVFQLLVVSDRERIIIIVLKDNYKFLTPAAVKSLKPAGKQTGFSMGFSLKSDSPT